MPDKHMLMPNGPYGDAPRLGIEFWKGAIWGTMLSSVLWLAIIFAVAVLL